jgi:hypothetical protein
MGRIQIVPILYRDRDFGALGDFEDFLESVSYGTSKTCQVRGSNPCRGARTSRERDCGIPTDDVDSALVNLHRALIY